MKYYLILSLLGIALLSTLVWYRGQSSSTLGAQTNTSPQPTPSALFTKSEVQSHNSSSSCWTIVQSTVYDVTGWIQKHPGGSEAILSVCGKDGTSAFEGQHGGERKPEAELATFQIGKIQR